MNDIPKKIVKPTFDSIHQLWDCRMWGVKGIDNVGNDNRFHLECDKLLFSYKSTYSNSIVESSSSDIILNDGYREFIIPQWHYAYTGRTVADGKTEQELNLQVSHLEQLFMSDKTLPHYWRYVYAVSDSEWFLKISAIPYQTESGCHYMHGLIPLSVDSQDLCIFYDRGEKSMIIESSSPLTEVEMDRLVLAVIVALGLVIGKYYGGCRFKVASDDKQFHQILGIIVDNLRPSKWCPYKIFDTERTQIISMLGMHDYQEYAKDEVTATDKDGIFWYYDGNPVGLDAFQKLSELLFKDDDMYVGASMLLDGSMLDAVYQVPFYCVSIETITSSLMKGVTKTPPPMSWDDYNEKVLPALKKVVDEMDIIPNAAKEIYKNKLANMNYPPNADKLTLSFEILGYVLTDADKDAINKRNKSFHGKLVSGSKPLIDQSEDMLALGMRLHKLCCILLLLASGFHGKILNNEVIFGIQEACARKEHAYVEI
jgi:hypothetical protein